MRVIGYIAFILVGLIATQSCDVNKRARKDAKKAFELYGDGEKYRAAKKFERINDKFPESNVHDRNLFNIAYIYQELDSNKKAIKHYKEILASTMVDSTRDSTRGNKETHTNFKFYSAKNLGIIYRDIEKYDKAIKYANIARFKHPYYHDDPKEQKRQEQAVDQLRAGIYERKGQLDSAVYAILPHALNESPWNQHPAEDMALRLIDQWIGRDAFLDKLDRALDNMVILPTFGYFRIDGFEIQIIPWTGEKDILSPEKLRRTHFYRELEGKL